MNTDFIRQKVKLGEYDLSEHAHKERQEERITVNEIEQALLKGDIIELYSNDPRGESCLIGFSGRSKPVHVVCGMRKDRLLIVTVYRPQLPVWINFETRARKLRSRE